MSDREEEIHNNDSQLLEQLKQASAGLLWLSESDYSWEVIYWDNIGELTLEKLRQQIDCDAGAKLEIRELDRFFEPAIQAQDWHNEAEKQEVERYQSLVDLLHNHLDNIQVYRVGEVEIDIYVLGETKHQAIAGLRTKAVET